MTVPWDAEEYSADLSSRMSGASQRAEKRLGEKWGDSCLSDAVHKRKYDNRDWICLDTPHTLVDRAGRILAWILPLLLSKPRQVSFSRPCRRRILALIGIS